MGRTIELPIVEFPQYVEELSKDFTHLFKQERQRTHFKQLTTGYVLAKKKNFSHMNGSFTDHSDQSNLNRFITGNQWDEHEMNRVKIRMINHLEQPDFVILDDVVVQKQGTKIYGKDWHYDHNLGRSVWG